jgi:hypothetical protein
MRQYMHQHLFEAPALPNRPSSAGQRPAVNGLIVKSIMCPAQQAQITHSCAALPDRPARRDQRHNGGSARFARLEASRRSVMGGLIVSEAPSELTHGDGGAIGAACVVPGGHAASIRIWRQGLSHDLWDGSFPDGGWRPGGEARAV